MILKIKYPLFAIAMLCFALTSIAQNGQITWHSFEEAVELNDKNPRKIFIDVYTDWCGWCKKMDQTTFKDEKIIGLLEKHFYSIKLDAEMKDTVRFRENMFVNPGAEGRSRSTHQLAASLLSNQMSYPSYVFMDGNYSILSPVKGYLSVEMLEKILRFYGENHYKSVTWEKFQEKN
jgi:thioredoxin-related protein